MTGCTENKIVAGTYNNQYMVVDLKKVHLGRTIDDNALWVVEQIPGLVVGADQTPTLRTGRLEVAPTIATKPGFGSSLTDP